MQDPETVGTAFKTISMRIRGAKTELEEMGEDTTGMVESTSKLREEILALSGVDIMASATEFKSTYQILDELARKWQDLSDIQQASVTELIAGKRQGNIISSLMANFDTAREVLETSASSAGSAMREHEKWMQSLDARINTLKASWQSLSQSFLSSDFLKVTIDGVTGLVNILDKLIQSLGTFGTIGLGVSIFNLLKNGKTILAGIKQFSTLFSFGMSTAQGFSEKLSMVSLAAQDAGKGIVKYFTSSLSGAVTGIGLAVAAIGLIVSAYKNYKEAISEARQETIRASDEFLDSTSSFEQAYIKYSGRTDLTVDEESELKSAIKGTVDALDDKSSALQNVVNSSNDYLSSLERIADEEIKAAARVAEAKRDAAEKELKDIVSPSALGLLDGDTSEVNVLIESSNMDTDRDNINEAQKIAKESAGKYYQLLDANKNIKYYGFELPSEASMETIVDYYYSLVDAKNKLLDKGLGDTGTFESIDRAIQKMSESIASYESGVYDAVKAQYQLLNGIPKTAEEYLKMREYILKSADVKNLSFNARNMIANTLDEQYGQAFDLSSAEIQAKKFIGLIERFGDGSIDGTNDIGTVETFLNMRTAVNNGECSVEEYLAELEKVKSMSDEYSDEEKEYFTTSLGLDTDKIRQQYDDVYKYVKRNYIDTIDASDYPNSINAWEYAKEVETTRIKDLLDGLTATELEAVVNLKTEIDWENSTTDEILAQIKEEAKFIEAMNYTIAIDVETESVDALNTAMAESVSATGLSSDSITALKGRYAELASQGYDLSAMFEETSNGIHLNKNAVSEFEQALASQKLSETDSKLDVLKGRYDELTEEIKTCTDAGERASLYSEQQEVAQKINDLATLASQYKGLTSAYNAWQNAESAGQERDMYESVIEGFETIGDEISRGWYDDGTIKFLELITGKTDLAGKSASELKEIWNSLDDTIKGTSYSIKDFFTTNENGESTSTGAYNFLRAVEELGKNGGLKALKGKNINELVERNSEGKIVAFDFDVVGGDKAVAEALGVSEEMVQIIQRTLDDAGFVVTLDGKYTLLADLKTSAEEANNTLKKLKTEGLESLKNVDLNFDFNVDTVEGYQEQLEKALNVLDKFRNKDGTLQTDNNGNLVEGAKEALEIAEYYTAAMDKLTEPKFMQIDTSTVNSELQDPIKKMQTIGDLCKEKHLVSLTGDTKELDKVQGEIDKVAKEIEELDPEVKAQIGIDENWDAKTIADKIEKGEIEIPAELKLDVQMSEDLKDIRLLMMRELGLVSENEVKLKIGYEIDDSTVDDLTPDEQKVAVEFIAENEDWFDKLTDDEKKVVIELVASGVDLDTLTDDEKKEVVLEFVTKNEDEFDKLTEEEKQVVVDLVTDDSALEALEEHGVEIEAFCNIFGVEKVDDLKKKLEQLDDEQILVLAKVLGRVDVEKLKTTVAGLDDKTVEAIAKALGEGDVNGLKTTINGLDDKTVKAIAKAFGYSDVSELNNAIDNLDPKTVQAIAKVLGITDVSSLKAAIDRLSNKDVKAVVNVDGIDDVNGLKSAIDNLKGKTVTVWAKIQKKASSLWDKLTGGGGVDGTAHADGTANKSTIRKSGRAFKQGDWGTKDSGIALGGEEAPELLVRNGRWHLIGEKGAEFFGYKKGDIIFNASQTREIFEKGKITHGNGRGKALVNGTAFLSGTAFSSGTGGGIEPEVPSFIVGYDYSENSSDSDSKKSQEIFDWIEVAIERIEREINNLDRTVNNVYKSWSSRNSALVSEINKIGNEIALQEKAYQGYINAANQVGLSSEWKKKVQTGTIDIDNITDETLAEKIKDYQKYYEQALACKDAVEELRETESSLYRQRFDNVQAQYDGILQGYEHTETMLNEYISQAEAQGHIISKKYYNALIDNEKQNIAKLKEEQSDLIKARDEAVASGTIKKYSQDWYDMCNEVDSVTQAIEEGTTALIEYNNAIRDVDWQVFDIIQERISDIAAESEFLIELMSNKDLFDDNGKFTNRGIATMGLHGLSYNTYMYQADDYGQEVAKLNKQIAKDPYDQELINRRRELVELQRESILEAENQKNAIRDLVEEGINLELDALQEKIDLHNEELDSMKDLYEYNERVKEQTEEISSLQKQLSAYSGDNSEESQKKVQELKVSLEKAEKELAETEFDRLIENTSALLDSLYTEYETVLNSRLDNIDFLLEQVIEGINMAAGAEGVITSALGAEGAIAKALGSGTTTIGETLKTEVGAVGTRLSSAMSNIWIGDGSGKAVIDLYGKDFQSKHTTTNDALNSIKANVAAMVDDVDKDAQKKVATNKTTTSAKKDPTKGSNNSNNGNKQNNASSNQRTDKEHYGVALAVWNGNYGWGNGDARQKRLKEKGFDASKVQSIVNRMGEEGYVHTAAWIERYYGITDKDLKKYSFNRYATGKKNFANNEWAWTQEKGQEYIIRPSDGAILTPIAKGDSVLNAAASGNIWSMANNPAEFIKDNLKLDAANVPNGSNVQNTYSQHIDNVVFRMDNVKNYEEMLYALRDDKRFEKLVTAMTIDRVAGKSSLAKGKAIR